MSGLDEKGLEAAVQAGNRLYIDANVGSVPTIQTYRTIIRAYLASATPADVGELVERLRAGVPPVWEGAEAANVTLSASATALERVVRERDEANELKAHARKCCDDADAKLAEARKVIEPFARAADNAERLAGHDGPLGQCVELEHLRAARRFIEETK